MQGVQFEDVWNLYNFDRELRLLLMDAIERIEVAFRTTLSNVMSVQYGSHWYLEEKIFKKARNHNELLVQINDICKRKKEPFIQHYLAEYHNPELPPSWMLIECLSFGTVVRILKNLKSMGDKNKICRSLGGHATSIESQLESLQYTRNLCAHHARIWNRWFVVTPRLPKSMKNARDRIGHSFYEQAFIISRLLVTISPKSNWLNKLSSLLDINSVVAKTSMGFCDNWQRDILWSI